MDRNDARLLRRAVDGLQSSNHELAKAINRQTDAMLEIERLKREREESRAWAQDQVRVYYGLLAGEQVERPPEFETEGRTGI